MVRLSEIIRKSGDKKYTERTGPLSKVFETIKKEETRSKFRKTYEEAILYVKRLMNNIKQGRTIEDRELIYVSEKIIDDICIDRNMLLSLVNQLSLDIKKENYLYEHSVNTSILATNIGLALRLNERELKDLCASSLLHDIGMLKIPEEIIKKPSKLTKKEYDQIKKHPLYGLELLKKIKYPPESAARVIYQHHEKTDGSGYPEGKKGDEISQHAKIVAIVETYAAMTHPRPYHRILPYEGTKMIVQTGRNSFDSEILKVFLKYITPYPPGSFVLLNNNEIGRVVSINEDLPMRPVVEIVIDAEMNPLDEPKRINLANSPVIAIKKAIDEPVL